MNIKKILLEKMFEFTLGEADEKDVAYIVGGFNPEQQDHFDHFEMNWECDEDIEDYADLILASQ